MGASVFAIYLNAFLDSMRGSILLCMHQCQVHDAKELPTELILFI